MRPPRFVYFAALFRRLAKICVSRTVSPSSANGVLGRSMRSSRPPAVDQALAHVDGMANDIRQVYLILSQLDLAVADARNFQEIVHKADKLIDLPLHHGLPRSLGGPSSPDRRNTAKPLRMGASGFRNSCARVAMNSSFRRSASFRAASARLRSVRSIVTPNERLGRPCSS